MHRRRAGHRSAPCGFLPLRALCAAGVAEGTRIGLDAAASGALLIEDPPLSTALPIMIAKVAHGLILPKDQTNLGGEDAAFAVDQAGFRIADLALAGFPGH